MKKTRLGWWFANKLDHCPNLFHHVLTISIAITFICEVSGKRNLQVPRPNFFSLSSSLLGQAQLPTDFIQLCHFRASDELRDWILTNNLITAPVLSCGWLLPVWLGLINCFGISASVGRHSVESSAGKVQCSWTGPHHLYIWVLATLLFLPRHKMLYDCSFAR